MCSMCVVLYTGLCAVSSPVQALMKSCRVCLCVVCSVCYNVTSSGGEIMFVCASGRVTVLVNQKSLFKSKGRNTVSDRVSITSSTESPEADNRLSFSVLVERWKISVGGGSGSRRDRGRDDYPDGGLGGQGLSGSGENLDSDS